MPWQLLAAPPLHYSLTLFAIECQLDYPVEFAEKFVIVFVPDILSAKRLLRENRTIIASKCEEWGQEKVELCWSLSEKPISIYPDTSLKNFSATNLSPGPNNSIVVPDVEVDFNAVYHSQNPIYITQMSDQTNQFANKAAKAAQGKKPKEFLGQSACALNDEEELERRCKLIYTNGRLIEYEYSALRWFQDPETGFWRRKRMNFTSNFQKVDYLGELCWLGEVLSAVETGCIIA